MTTKLTTQNWIDAGQPLILVETLSDSTDIDSLNTVVPAGFEDSGTEDLDAEVEADQFNRSDIIVVDCTPTLPRLCSVNDTSGFVLEGLKEAGLTTQPQVSIPASQVPLPGLLEAYTSFAYGRLRDAMQEDTMDDLPAVVLWIRNAEGILGPEQAIYKGLLSSFTRWGLNSRVHIVFSATPGTQVPKELEDEIAVVPFALPTDTQYREVLETISSASADISEDALAKSVIACRGLSLPRALMSSAVSVISTGGLSARTVSDLKSDHLKKTTGLDVWLPEYDQDEQWNLDRVIGMEFTKDILRRGLRQELKPRERLRHVLILGVPGTGKSMLMKAAAGEFGLPLCQIRAAAMYSKWVGDSDKQLEALLKAAEEIGGFLGIDEFTRFMPGQGGDSGTQSSGMENRLAGQLLGWLQEQTRTCVLSATNSMGELDAEVTRPGRVDYLLFAGFPDDKVKDGCWEYYMKLYNREDKRPTDTRAWTPVDIATCCKLANMRDVSLIEQAKNMSSILDRYEDQIVGMAKWAAQAGCLDASTGEPFKSLSVEASKSTKKRPSSVSKQPKRAAPKQRPRPENN